MVSGAPQDFSDQHRGQGEIGSILGLPGNFGDGIGTIHSFSYDVKLGHTLPRHDYIGCFKRAMISVNFAFMTCFLNSNEPRTKDARLNSFTASWAITLVFISPRSNKASAWRARSGRLATQAATMRDPAPFQGIITEREKVAKSRLFWGRNLTKGA